MKRLWLDLGNTRLKYWLTDNGEVMDKGAELHLQAPAELLMGLTDRFSQFNPDFIGVSSVLGHTINISVENTLSKLNIPFEFVSVKAQHKKMATTYAQEQLGVDRWLQMLAVAEKNKKVCVVGCGTALTIDLIDDATHQGGYIFPSIYLQRESLQSGTRQISIPESAFKEVTVGTTTADAVHRGILLSIVGAVNEILCRNPEYELVMTGGDARTIAEHLNTDYLVKPVKIIDDLLLRGLQGYFD